MTGHHRVVLYVCGYQSHWTHYVTSVYTTDFDPAAGRRGTENDA